MNYVKLVAMGAAIVMGAGLYTSAFADQTNSHGHGDNHGTMNQGGNHGSMNHGDGHGSMKMESPADVTEAEAKGKINSIDAEGGKVNVTHDPVPSLGWPQMTMDLPVTRRVDLSGVKAGSDVVFKLKKGRDNQFRIIEITPAN